MTILTRHSRGKDQLVGHLYKLYFVKYAVAITQNRASNSLLSNTLIAESEERKSWVRLKT